MGTGVNYIEFNHIIDGLDSSSQSFPLDINLKNALEDNSKIAIIAFTVKNDDQIDHFVSVASRYESDNVSIKRFSVIVNPSATRSYTITFRIYNNETVVDAYYVDMT